MKWNDLPKQKQLLIYMFYYEAESGLAITMSKNGNDIIAYGISKNKNSLANMLYNLRKKKLVSETILKDGSFAYPLTISGQNEAKHWIECYDKDDCLPGNVGQSDEIEIDWVSLANMFTDAAKSFIQRPKKNNKLQEENAALVEEIKKLKYDLHCAKEAYDYKVKECEQLTSDVNNLVSACKNLKNERNDAMNERNSLIISMKKASDTIHSMETKIQELHQENDDHWARIAALKQTLTERCAQLDEKTKRVEFLENGLEKIAANCHYMGKWAIMMKEGIGKTA